MKPSEIETLRKQHKERILPATPMILVGMGTCGIGNGAATVYHHFEKVLSENNFDCKLKQAGCFGFCAEEPMVMFYQPGKPMLVYSKVEVKDVKRIIDNLHKNRLYKNKLLCRIDEWDFLTSEVEFGKGYEDIPHWDEVPFFKGQKKVVFLDELSWMNGVDGSFLTALEWFWNSWRLGRACFHGHRHHL